MEKWTTPTQTPPRKIFSGLNLSQMLKHFTNSSGPWGACLLQALPSHELAGAVRVCLHCTMTPRMQHSSVRSGVVLGSRCS